MDDENKRLAHEPPAEPAEQPSDNFEPPVPEDSEVQVDEPVPEEPEPVDEPAAPESKPSRLTRFKNWYGSHKKWAIPATIIIVVALLATIPWSRYKAAGLVLKQNYSVEVLDSTTNSPVSGAEVRVGSVSTLTDGQGRATLEQIPVGNRTVLVTKKYYKDHNLSVLIPISASGKESKVSLEATGRQVKIQVNHYITGKPVGEVDIKISDIEAKTDTAGGALVVLPADAQTQEASLSLKGFNAMTTKVTVTDKIENPANNFKLVPAGKIYFLSRLSGKIDVVKTNLDGSERKTVLAGTGKEENSGTVLLANRDWKYLALLSRRSSGPADLYLIETATDKLTPIDTANADFNLAGWSGDYFIYTANKRGVDDWEPKKVALKSYNAATKQLLLLDQTGAAGDQNGSTEERIGDVYTHDDTVVYRKIWYAYGNFYYDDEALNGKVSGLYSIKNNGRDSKRVRTIEADKVSYIETTSGKPGQIFMTIAQDDGPTLYTEYMSGGVETASSEDLPESLFTYLLSPSGKETFWSDERDGKNTLLVGDAGGNSPQTVATLSDYETYGWFGDEYLLVSKNSSELYVMAKAGGSENKPQKISDYHKPSLDYYGYGGGYGGI